MLTSRDSCSMMSVISRVAERRDGSSTDIDCRPIALGVDKCFRRDEKGINHDGRIVAKRSRLPVLSRGYCIASRNCRSNLPTASGCSQAAKCPALGDTVNPATGDVLAHEFAVGGGGDCVFVSHHDKVGTLIVLSVGTESGRSAMPLLYLADVLWRHFEHHLAGWIDKVWPGRLVVSPSNFGKSDRRQMVPRLPRAPRSAVLQAIVARLDRIVRLGLGSIRRGWRHVRCSGARIRTACSHRWRHPTKTARPTPVSSRTRDKVARHVSPWWPVLRLSETRRVREGRGG